MEKQIKVAMIPDNTRIVINAGYDDYPKISIGGELEVYKKGPDIIDPDTSDIIDTYSIVKARLEFTNVYEHYSVARKIVEEIRPSFATMVSPLLEERTTSKIKTLNVNDNQNLNISYDDKVINIGDLVKLL